MKLRAIKKQDLRIIRLMLFEQGRTINQETLINQWQNATTAKLIEDNGIEGFIIIKDLAGEKEITQWHLKPEHQLIMKAITKQVKKPIVTHEQINNKERIKLLEKTGFKKIKISKGILRQQKAAILRLD